jgi:hypothetical protein
VLAKYMSPQMVRQILEQVRDEAAVQDRGAVKADPAHE